MSVIDRVKFDASDDSIIVWKYPSEDLKVGSQVIVNQSQEAVFVKGGEALDVLGPGTHTLSTGNIPLINKIINAPFGGETPFTAEIWYVNKTVKRDLKWGTAKAIQLFDTRLGYPVSVRSFGQWGFLIENSRLFINKIVGSRLGTNTDDLDRYFIGEIRQKLSNILSNAVGMEQFSVLNIATQLNKISGMLAEAVSSELQDYGVKLVNFNIESINIPSDEMAKVQEVFAKKMEISQLSSVDIGNNYAKIKSFEIMEAAAKNEGNGGVQIGSMLNAGIGIGAGLPIGQQLGQQLSLSSAQPPNTSDENVTTRLALLLNLLNKGLISKDQYESKQEEILKNI